MTRLISFILLSCYGVAYAVYGVEVLSRFGPTRSTANVTVAAAGSGVRNCLKNLDVVSDNAYTLRVLDGGTTTYTVAASSGAVIIRAWDVDDLFCGSANTAMYITVSNGNFNINYAGFTY